MRPAVFAEWSQQFKRVVELAATGKIGEARHAFCQIDGDALKYWFHYTAQYAGSQRTGVLASNGSQTTSPVREKRAARTPSKRTCLELLARDNWACRYCGSPLLHGDDFRSLRGKMGETVFPAGRTNLATHGAKFVFLATFDHVLPHSLGGGTDAGNIVSSCHACNFGKDGFTLDELGLDYPAGDRFAPDQRWLRAVHALRTK